MFLYFYLCVTVQAIGKNMVSGWRDVFLQSHWQYIGRRVSRVGGEESFTSQPLGKSSTDNADKAENCNCNVRGHA